MKDPLESMDVKPSRVLLLMSLIVAGVVALAFFEPHVLGTIVVIVAFFVMIMLHELGHFVMAKRAGMKVTEFFVGFGPRIWSVQRGETEYGLKALPLGGYCKIVGMTNLEEVDPPDEPRAYRSQEYGPKIGVAVAGSAMHFLIAIVLMLVVLSFAGNFRDQRVTTTLDEVVTGAPADEAGLRIGDIVRSIDGELVESWNDVPDLVRDRGGETVDFEITRNGVTAIYPVKLVEQVSGNARRGYAGIRPLVVVPEPGIVESVWRAPWEVARFAGGSVGALVSMFSPSGISEYLGAVTDPDGEEADRSSESRLLSPVGFGRLASQAAESGWVDTVLLLVLVNVFVGVFNMLPLLPFDGGHVAIATYETVASRVLRRRVRADVAKLLPLTAMVVAVLGFIFLSSVFLDIANPIENPF